MVRTKRSQGNKCGREFHGRRRIECLIFILRRHDFPRKSLNQNTLQSIQRMRLVWIWTWGWTRLRERGVRVDGCLSGWWILCNGCLREGNSRQRAEKEKLFTVLDWLSPISQSNKHYEIQQHRRKFPLTTQWLFNDRSWLAFINCGAFKPEIFWLSGIPGAG